jgi:hypothetical protein
MNAQKGRSHADDVIASLRGTETAAKFTAARTLLRRHLIHTREIPNGKDFLFLGPKTELHDALRVIVDVEQAGGKRLHFNYAELVGYFLLRVSGSEADQENITGYFE